MTRARLLGLGLVALAASGCGLKGPLYLPDKSEVTIRPAPTQAAPEAPAAPEAAGGPPAEPEQTPGPEQPPQDPPRDPVRG